RGAAADAPDLDGDDAPLVLRAVARRADDDAARARLAPLARGLRAGELRIGERLARERLHARVPVARFADAPVEGRRVAVASAQGADDLGGGAGARDAERLDTDGVAVQFADGHDHRPG